MKKALLSFCLLLFAFTSQAETPYVNGEVILQLKNGYSVEDITKSAPVNYELKAIQRLSVQMNIWLFSFRSDLIPNTQMLAYLRMQKAVRLVQNNHYVQERATVPNDATFGSQWHHKNTGQSGGTVDSDIDSDEAWDITTGGLTSMGDTIVVCIVEGGGANYSHPDLIDNFWHNHQEIPGNTIDDDGNGYVDDYDGWNVQANNDNHGTGGHGTQCMGMTGAKGNNTIGVAGANWNVKLMLVSGFSTTESSVIAAYDYPLTMRQMYNQSNGANGAFVVATSASWGIDNADPADYPLWCAVYDALGAEGILNAGATANNNVNIDVVGDMPTACASTYMISVTATNDDDVRTFSGYGQTTIDLGAPGENVYTTSGTNSYGSTSGTSFACPLTAGAIALIYSAPCNSFMTLVKANPQAGADQVRLALLNGVDPVANLTTETVTGGRLNLFNSINEIINNCTAGGCVTPFALSASSVSDTSAVLAWSNAGASNDFWLHIRLVGSSVWDSVYVSNDTLVIDTLLACSSYEFQVQSDCGMSGLSNYSSVTTFDTDGCCEAPAGLAAVVLTDSTASVSWNSVLAAQTYNIRYKEVSSSTWIDVNGVTSPLALTNLLPCTIYEVQVQTVCDTGATAYTASVTFSTTGCGNCEDLPYCNSAGADASAEYIDTYTFGTITNNSGNNSGYGLYTSMLASVYQGEVVPFSLAPAFSGSQFEYVKIWIDYNQDGDFADSGEEVFTQNFVNATISGNITVPVSAVLGSTRMRVAMKGVSFSDFSAPTPCANPFPEGEVEDYCLLITVDPNGVQEISNTESILIYPNPAANSLNIEWFGTSGINSDVEIISATGQVVLQRKLNSSKNNLDISALPNGVYFIRVTSDGTIQRSGKVVVQR